MLFLTVEGKALHAAYPTLSASYHPGNAMREGNISDAFYLFLMIYISIVYIALSDSNSWPQQKATITREASTKGFFY